MAGEANILRELFVRISYQIKDENKARESLARATAQVAQWYAAVEAAALGVVAATSRMARGMEEVYYASRRLGGSAADIQGFSYALSQVGGSAEGARSALEGIASFLRSSPGSEGLFASLGVQVRDANGALRATDRVAADLGARLAQMPFYRARAYANTIGGIDDRTLFALRSGEYGRFQSESADLYRRAGLDTTQSARDAHDFMVRMRSLQLSLNVLEQKVGAALFRGVGQNVEQLRNYIVDNFDRITAVIIAATKAILGLATVLTQATLAVGAFASRTFDWFNSLDTSSQRVIEAFSGLLVAWRVLSAGFLATPLTVVVASLAALLLLMDDYRVWKEGGKSHYDWKSWDSTIQGMLGGAAKIAGVFDKAVQAVGGWQDALAALSVFMIGTWLTRMMFAIGRVTSALAGGAAGGAAAGGSAVGGLLRWVWRASPWLAGLATFLDPTPANAGEAKDLKDWLNNGGAQQTKVSRLFQKGLTGTPGYADHEVSPTQYRGAALAPDMIRYLVTRYGLSLGAAAGIVANLKDESGLDINNVGDEGYAHGLAQWNSRHSPDRIAAIERAFGKPIAAMDAREQLDAVMWELNAGGDKQARAAGAILHTQGLTAANYSDAVTRLYERPANVDYASAVRAKMAMELSDSATSAGVVVQQTNHVTVTGSSDPRSAASQIGQEQTRLNGALVRQMKGAVR